MHSTTAPDDRSRSRILRSATVGFICLAAVAGSQAPASATADSGPSCPDVEVVFARGTFEAPGVGDTGQAFIDALDSRLPGRSVAVYAVNYPASLDFQEAAQGVIDASNEVESIAAVCSHTKIVLGGYSQGAAVAGYTTFDALPVGYVIPPGITGPMPANISPHVAAVALFGKPSNGFLGIIDSSAPPITIGQLYSAKTLELCASGDPVCGGGLDRAAHSAYKDNGMADQAAEFVVNAVTSSPM
jgi:cutinase